MILLALLLSVVALARVSGDVNGTDQVETAEAAKTNWLERNGTAFGAVAALLAIIAYLSGFVSHIKKIILAKLGTKPPENTSQPPQISTENRTITTPGERSKAIGGDVSNSIIADTINLTPETLGSLHPNPTEPPGKISNITHPHNPNFTGRVDLLDGLHAALSSGQYAAVTQTQAIIGLGGVGKTQLALEYTYRHMDDYETVWWVRSDEPATQAADYANLAAKLDLPGNMSPDLNVVIEVVKTWLEQNDDWLLVFDNVQDPEDLDNYLPHTGKGHVIVTSRNPNWGGIIRTLPVDVFSRDESIEFLRHRTGLEDGADALSAALGDLPLALEQAGAYIKETGISLEDYLNRFQEQQKEVLKRGKPASYPYTVATTWKISFERVKEDPGAGADLLNLCAFLAPDNIPKPLLIGGAEHLPEPLASAVADELKFDDAVAALMRYSLLTVADNTLSVHRLVQAVTRDRLSDEVRERWAAAAAQLVNDVFPQKSDDVRTWNECLLLLPHALAAAGHAEEQGAAPEATGRLLNQVGLYLQERAEFDGAKFAYERALKIDEKAYGPDHPNVATVANNIGSVLHDI
ncbi:MAG: FxSxx-COOH system tetratricopeptide repeat protein, partial [Euryarchaeota archaeon]|nr:FxSxx-COOH system tetratricopeptide repeat protein [Euryarchaeota archaeon]